MSLEKGIPSYLLFLTLLSLPMRHHRCIHKIRKMYIEYINLILPSYEFVNQV